MTQLEKLIERLGWANLSNESKEIFKLINTKLNSIFEDAPSDDVIYGRKNGAWEEVLVSEGGEDTRPYTVYTALLNQTGTSAPVATVLEDTLEAGITFGYVGVGRYSVTIADALDLSKSAVTLGNTYNYAGYFGTLTGLDPNYFEIRLKDAANEVASNGALFNTVLEIKVYN